jgi:hypothetical protein
MRPSGTRENKQTNKHIVIMGDMALCFNWLDEEGSYVSSELTLGLAFATTIIHIARWHSGSSLAIIIIFSFFFGLIY